MDFGIRIDQPELGRPGASRRLHFGPSKGPAMVILNGVGNGFEGGSDAPDLSLKWVPKGRAEYRTEGHCYPLSGATQLLLNRGQAYRLNLIGPAETFVLFFPRQAADEAWQSQTGASEPMPEIPTAAARAPATLHSGLANLRAESREPAPDAERLQELCCEVLVEIAALAELRRGQVRRIPAARRSTREELLRRLLRAETYLEATGCHATLGGAASAAALSRFHLIRLFQATFGETPLAYGVAIRLERARDELATTRKSIAEIAETAGYESRTAFDRAFARRFRATPGSVRASAG